MSVQIQNLTDRPLVLMLSSGRTLHLAPAATSDELADVEVKNNAKLDRLGAQRVIAVLASAEATPSARKAPREPAS